MGPLRFLELPSIQRDDRLPSRVGWAEQELWADGWPHPDCMAGCRDSSRWLRMLITFSGGVPEKAISRPSG